MFRRYQVSEGIVIRRRSLPSGDVVATILSQGGKWRGVARKGTIPGGNLGRLSLFHDVTVQSYRRHEQDLAVLTQVQLNGALPNLSRPEIYPLANLLAELADALTVGVHLGERIYQYLASGLRGLNRSGDPERVAIVFCWRLLQVAGLAPRVRRCLHCGADPPLSHFDIVGGGLSCGACRAGLPIPAATGDDLRVLLSEPVRIGLDRPLSERALHLNLLRRYCGYHVAELRSLSAPAPGGARAADV